MPVTPERDIDFPRGLISPTEAEIRFLRMIKEKKGEATIADALDFENHEPEPGFGPDVDALDLLDKYISNGVFSFDEKSLKYRYEGFNHPKPDYERLQFDDEVGIDF